MTPRAVGHRGARPVSRFLGLRSCFSGLPGLELGSPADKKSSPTPPAPLRSPFQAKKRNLRGKAALPKRCSPKGLLQLTKHRLCRLPAARSPLAGREGRKNHLLPHLVLRERFPERLWERGSRSQLLQEAKLLLSVPPSEFGLR
ncbi:Zinc finger CCCH domain-containing protein 3 [Aix galericulata]|nr:Zinc finger CCCH domain-containing protein 3 [Aix galericulata]